LKHQLNWLSITAISLIATLVPVAGSHAAETVLSTSTSTNLTLIANHTPNDSSHPQIAVGRRKYKGRIKVKRKKQTPVVTPTTDPTSLPTDLTQTTPPPVPPTPPAPAPAPVAPPAPVVPTTEAPKAPETTPPAATTPAPSTFSLTTKLEGQVIFGATGAIGGDFTKNTAFGNRTRLEFITDINGGTLTTRLQSTGLGLSNTSPAAVATPEGSLSWTDDTKDNAIGVDALKYEFSISPQTQVVVAANAGASDDFADTINPYFDGDGASGSISAFGNRPSIYYTVQGAGVGIRHKLDDKIELSLGYLANSPNNPADGNGLFGGGYGALAQLTFQTGENSKVGVTYTRTLNSGFGTGSNNATTLNGNSNNFGVQGSFQINPQLALGGWAGYSQNEAAGGDRQIWNWALTAAAPDFGGKGNLAGFLVGQEPRVTSSNDGTTDSKSGLHIEGFYQVKLSDNLSITPGLIYLTAPDQKANSNGAVIGALRTTFSF
jgi:hypothetical protein